MKRQSFIYLLLCCLLLSLFTACQQEQVTTAQPIICEDFEIEGKISLGVHIPKSNEIAYVSVADADKFTGNIADFPLEIYQMQKGRDGYKNPKAFILPDGFTYSNAMALSPDGKKMYLSAQNETFFGNDSINLLVGEISGNTLINLEALDAINTSNSQFIMSVDDNQNLIYLAHIGDAYSQVFYAAYENGSYTQGIVMSDAINTQSTPSNGAVLSPDGKTLINTHQFYRGNMYPSLLVASSLNVAHKWEMATAFDLPINDLEKFKLMPTISGDGKTLYYVSIPLNAMADSIDLKATKLYKVDLDVALNTLLPTNQQATNHPYDTSEFELTLRNKENKDSKQGVYYEIFVRAFADSDGDGIGDFNGLTSKLDYLKDLGVEGLWLMPINASPSYHGYDVTDYGALNSDYGTEEDFKRLLDEAHKRDIKIIMDFVINHTSSLHPWFKSATFSEKSPYRDYYRIVDPNDTENYIDGAKSPWQSDVWHPINNLYYYGIFSDIMPDLNYNNPNVREEIKAAARKWLEMGVDGFRLDAALHIYGVHEFEKQEDRDASNIQWWNEFAAACEAVNPNVYLVGEAWDSDNPLEDYVQPFDTKFNFTLQSDMLYAIKNGLSLTSRGNDLASSLETLLETYDAVDANYLDGIFASNHDQERIMSSVVLDQKVRLFPHIYLTLPGNPYLYYGEELGMKGTKPDELLRVGFKWSDDISHLPNCFWEQTMWGDDYSRLNQDTPSLETQAQDSTSLYNLYKTLIHLRKSHEALTLGDFKALNTSHMSVLGYRRFTENEDLIILHNLSSKPITVALEELDGVSLIYTSSKAQDMLSGTNLTLPGYTSVICKR